ncbi:HD-GYP domain-containing protein [Fibrobacter sp. UWB12]|uniref:HD-GYP domain-containing protein n=1 Tax=Fibrobacter sp. UWB12 TaxID=1896203 RepID=UPI0009123EE0|nr:HD domain-containing phosphohydrolase [Fibrobacter sp. UWB12]SHK74872.1 GAF domain-containing protein [Fibrobacter sp. UWB12]
MSYQGNATDLGDGEVAALLFEYMPKIAAEHKTDSLLVLMADLGRKIVQADRCSLWLIDEEKNELWTKVAHGVSELRIPLSAGFVGYSLKTGEPVLVEDAYRDARFDRRSDIKNGYHTTSVMTMPLESDGRVMGVFQAINKVGDNVFFSSKDLERLKLISVYSAKTIESAFRAQKLERYAGKLERYTNELKSAHMELIRILGEVSEFRSQEVGDHIHRVAEISLKLARYLGLSLEQQELIFYAAPLHDLGKVGIPDVILNKAGRLTPEEYSRMKAHSIIGRTLLRDSKTDLLCMASDIAGAHHERWDGMGYPDKLKGEEIPLAARICAVADVLDALSSPRCYKAAWPEDRVKEEMKNSRGTHFQPELIDILMEHWDDFFACYRPGGEFTKKGLL